MNASTQQVYGHLVNVRVDAAMVAPVVAAMHIVVVDGSHGRGFDYDFAPVIGPVGMAVNNVVLDYAGGHEHGCDKCGQEEEWLHMYLRFEIRGAGGCADR